MARRTASNAIKPTLKRRPSKHVNEFVMPAGNLDAFFGQLRQKFAPVLETLTPRESEITPLLAFGQPHSMIAAKFGISPKTLDIHRANILRKFGVANRQISIAYLAAAGVLGG